MGSLNPFIFICLIDFFEMKIEFFNDNILIILIFQEFQTIVILKKYLLILNFKILQFFILILIN